MSKEERFHNSCDMLLSFERGGRGVIFSDIPFNSGETSEKLEENKSLGSKN